MFNSRILIAGLGNPGRLYAMTRHNMGFLVVSHLAKIRGWQFRFDVRSCSKVASGLEDRKEVFLFLPMTGMNLSGRAIFSFCKRYSVNIMSILVIVDELCLLFGSAKLREKGSSGGHNGLKSIERAFSSTNFARLKIGIGNAYPKGEAKEYVLSSFTKKEENAMPTVLQQMEKVINLWVHGDIYQAKNVASTFSLSFNDQGEILT